MEITIYSIKDWESLTIDENNTVNGAPVYFWKNIDGGVIPSGAGEIILANCSNVTIVNQNCSYGSMGVLMAYSDNITIINNSFNHNSVMGFWMVYSNNNLFENNSFSDNDIGIYLPLCSSNTFINNSIWNAYDYVGGNNWDGGYQIGGNYWYDYTGNDQLRGINQSINGTDGFGDIPYNLSTDGFKKDNYPLIDPVKKL